MATYPLPIALSLLVICFSFTVSSSSASEINHFGSDTSNYNKVSVGLYYESLCPYSANFIVNDLTFLVEDEELLSVVDLYLSPWGNARIKGNDSFSCQHGPLECLLNTVEACAIHVWPKLEGYFPFVYCVETLVFEHKSSHWESCFDLLGLDPKPIVDCYSGRDGTELELQYALETSTLQPPHQYVPWVVVDGQPLYEDYENFISYICAAYKGSASLTACNKTSRNTNQWGKAKSVLTPVCYRDTTLSTISERFRTVFSRMENKIKKFASI